MTSRRIATLVALVTMVVFIVLAIAYHDSFWFFPAFVWGLAAARGAGWL